MTTITASTGGESGTATLTVTEPTVNRVAVSPSSPSIEEGETEQFSATAYSSSNNVISGKTFTWKAAILRRQRSVLLDWATGKDAVRQRLRRLLTSKRHGDVDDYRAGDV